MSCWTHVICGDCWEARNPERTAHRLRTPRTDVCCFCGQPTEFGAFIRHDPTDPDLTCKGEHP